MGKNTKENPENLEETTEIKIGDAKIGLFNIVLYIVLIIICIIYFFTH